MHCRPFWLQPVLFSLENHHGWHHSIWLFSVLQKIKTPSPVRSWRDRNVFFFLQIRLKFENNWWVSNAEREIRSIFLRIAGKFDEDDRPIKDEAVRRNLQVVSARLCDLRERFLKVIQKINRDAACFDQELSDEGKILVFNAPFHCVL